MRRHWKTLTAVVLVLGAGYLLFCLAIDAYENHRRALPDRELQARMDRMTTAVDAFIAGADDQVPSGAEMLFWEWQSWESGGGRSRLTLWSNGRSEFRVWPCSYDTDGFELKPKPGWTAITEDGDTVFVRDPVDTDKETRLLFRKAFRLGVHRLEPVKRDYVDGGGLVIGIQKNGILNQQTYPEFGVKHWETRNYVRFKALCRLLGECDPHEGFSFVAKRETANKPMQAKPNGAPDG